MAEGFKDTLNLPVTDFPMRASLAQREPERLSAWLAEDLYGRIQEMRAGAGSFILHDGPPYANGNIHIGHTLNKVLKDFVVRYKSLRGYRAPYIPGWDCHGLPIEQQVLKKVGDKIHDMEPLELRKLCLEYAQEWIEVQRRQFQRLGILGDWDRPYLTIDPTFEAGILEVLRALASRGLVRKGYKAVHWDPVFRTALAEAEIEYHPHESPSIYVAMELIEPSRYPSLAGLDNAAFVIWTTTPWTMPANLGVSLHPEFEYVAIQGPDGRNFIVAEGLRERFAAACGLEDAPVVAKFLPTELDRAEARHPIFPDKTSLVMLGEHVTLEQGTGCVHTAPGHGADDFTIGRQYGLPVFCPVDNRGCYTAEYPEMEGVFVFDANPKVVELLRERGLLLAHKTIKHDYPYSWRSRKPIIFRATEQWFVELAEGGIREEALQAIDESVEWVPPWGRDRIRAMVERRPEWCISRQRHWGVPIPAVRHLPTNQAILDPRVIENFIEAVRERGTDAWYSEPLQRFLPDDWNVEEYEREHDILDVWFDSGASHTALLKSDPRVSYPADLYLEGSDQHRGWFQSALLLGMGAHHEAPFKAVLTHGFVLDGEGKAMSKSLGNVISPLDLIDKYGADILRLWVASIDYRNDVSMSEEIIKTTADTYRTIRNSLRFQLGNLYDFNFARDAVSLETLTALDRWALHQLAQLAREVTEAYERYEFHRVYQLLNQFYTVTLSARYHDILKDRLYTFRSDSPERRSAQTVIYHQVHTLLQLLAPILAFTTDEAWESFLSQQGQEGSRLALSDWPDIPDAWLATNDAEEIDALLGLREKVNESLEALRGAKEIGKSIDAVVRLTGSDSDALYRIAKKHADALPELFIVSAVQLDSDDSADKLRVQASPAEGVRCPRCWRRVAELVSTSPEPVCPRCAEAIHGAPT